MRVRMTIDSELFYLLENECKEYNCSMNNIINKIIKSSHRIFPRFYDVGKNNRKKDVHIHSDAELIWYQNLMKYNDCSGSKLLRAYISSYFLLSRAVKEEIIFKKEFLTIKNSIDNLKSLVIEYSKDNKIYTKRKVDPYKIVSSNNGGHYYLIAFCHKCNELRVFRLSRIKEIKFCKTDFCIRESYKKIDKALEIHFDGFLSYGKYVKVEFKNGGLELFEKISLNRPREIDKKEIQKEKYKEVPFNSGDIENKNVKFFECSEYQCEVYFFQFLDKVQILYPDFLRFKMIERLKKALYINIKMG